MPSPGIRHPSVHALLPDDDMALVAAATSGDREAQRRLIERLTPSIRSAVRRRLFRSRALRGETLAQEIADAVQEALAALLADDWRALRRWSPESGSSLCGFAALIAERETIDSIRRRGRRPQPSSLAPEDSFDRVESNGDCAEGRLAAHQMIAVITQGVRERFGERGLAVFQGLVIEGRSVEEVRARAGMSAAAVHTFHARVRRMARQLAA